MLLYKACMHIGIYDFPDPTIMLIVQFYSMIA